MLYSWNINNINNEKMLNKKIVHKTKCYFLKVYYLGIIISEHVILNIKMNNVRILKNVQCNQPSDDLLSPIYAADCASHS